MINQPQVFLSYVCERATDLGKISSILETLEGTRTTNSSRQALFSLIKIEEHLTQR